MLSCKISNEEKDILVAIFDSCCIELVKYKSVTNDYKKWNDEQIQFQINTVGVNTFFFIGNTYGCDSLNQDDFMMMCSSLLKEKLMWHADILSRLHHS